VIMSLGLPAALMNYSLGPVDNTQYDPINKWSYLFYNKPQATRRTGQI
jgi:hypothetical protein